MPGCAARCLTVLNGHACSARLASRLVRAGPRGLRASPGAGPRTRHRVDGGCRPGGRTGPAGLLCQPAGGPRHLRAPGCALATPPPLTCGRSIPPCSWPFASVNWAWPAGGPSSAPSNWRTASRRPTTSASSCPWPSRRRGIRAACRRSGRTAQLPSLRTMFKSWPAWRAQLSAGAEQDLLRAYFLLALDCARRSIPRRRRRAALAPPADAPPLLRFRAAVCPRIDRRGGPRRAGEERPRVRGDAPVPGGAGLQQPHAADGREAPGRGREGDARSSAGVAAARARPPGDRGTRPGP